MKNNHCICKFALLLWLLCFGHVFIYAQQAFQSFSKTDTTKLENAKSSNRTLNENVHSNISIGSSSLKNNDSGIENIAIGNQSLSKNYSGSLNIAIGINSQKQNLSSASNISIGNHSLSKNLGEFNIAIGDSALALNNLGTENIAFGVNALKSNTTGVNNTAMGYNTLNSNTIGSYNTSFGEWSMKDNVSGIKNTALGPEALRESKGDLNTGIGLGALGQNISGNGNTAIGAGAFDIIGAQQNQGHDNVAVGSGSLGNNYLGNNNVALGHRAMEYNIIGNNNTAIGTKAQVVNANNSVAIGFGLAVYVSNTIKIGNAQTSSIVGPQNYIISDARFKDKVSKMQNGLNFILKLKPVTYNFDYLTYAKFNQESNLDSILLVNKSKQTELGLIAQEVEDVSLNNNFSYSNYLHTPENEHDSYSLSYSMFVVPLIKAVKEQDYTIKSLQLRMLEMNAKLAELDDNFTDLENKIKHLKKVR